MEFIRELWNFLRVRKKYEEAIYCFDYLKNDFGTALSLECLYLSKNYDEFYKRLKSLSALKDMNLRVAAVSIELLLYAIAAPTTELVS